MVQPGTDHIRFVGAYWQTCGLPTIPTASWGALNSFSYCFEGLPCNSIIATSKRKLWDADYELFASMRDNSLTPNEANFFKNMRFKEEYEPTALNDLLVSEYENPDEIYLVRVEYDEYLVGHGIGTDGAEEVHVMNLSMGNGADFFARDADGRRSEYTSLAPAVTINGVKGHLIKRNEDSDTHTNLPFYANTSDVYFRQNKNGVCQARVYIGQKLHLDFGVSF